MSFLTRTRTAPQVPKKGVGKPCHHSKSQLPIHPSPRKKRHQQHLRHQQQRYPAGVRRTAMSTRTTLMYDPRMNPFYLPRQAAVVTRIPPSTPTTHRPFEFKNSPPSSMPCSQRKTFSTLSAGCPMDDPGRCTTPEPLFNTSFRSTLNTRITTPSFDSSMRGDFDASPRDLTGTPTIMR